MADIKEVLDTWQPYVSEIESWQDLVKDVTPKDTECGPVYELPNPVDRPGESFAISDMREVAIAEPHAHTNGETEIYFVLSGLGKTFVGKERHELRKGVSVVIPPDTIHLTIPEDDLVLAVVNTPPFSPDNVVELSDEQKAVARRIAGLG